MVINRLFESLTLTWEEFTKAEREVASEEQDADLQRLLASTAGDEARGNEATADADEAINLYFSEQKETDPTVTVIFNPARDGDCLLRAAENYFDGSTAEELRARVAERASCLAIQELYEVTARIREGMFADPMNKGALTNLVHILKDVSNDILPDFAFEQSPIFQALASAESETVPDLETALVKLQSSLTDASTRRELAIQERMIYNSRKGNVLGDDALQALADVTGAIVEV